MYEHTLSLYKVEFPTYLGLFTYMYLIIFPCFPIKQTFL